MGRTLNFEVQTGGADKLIGEGHRTRLFVTAAEFSFRVDAKAAPCASLPPAFDDNQLVTGFFGNHGPTLKEEE